MQLKKYYTQRKLFFIALLFFFLDIVLMGFAHEHIFYGSRIAFITSVFARVPVAQLVLYAWFAGIIAFVATGIMIDELALAGLVALSATLIIPHTLRTRFAFCVLASICLLSWIMLGQLIIGHSVNLSGWTILQIIGNIVVICSMMKYMS